jgi:general secretion pathway protein B
MSFILEALRKSEAERRRGQAPDLLSETMPVAPAARVDTSSRGQRVAIVAAALIALLLVAWALRPTAPVESAASAPAPSTSTTAAVTLPAPSTSLSPPLVRVAAPPTVRKPTSAPPVATPLTTAATATPSTAPQIREPQPEATEPNIDVPAAPTQVATTQPASATAFVSPDVPLKLADLSADERQQLPALKLSMHMWAPDAANRFAIIDGARVNEGDRIGDTTVEAIQQDAVMLNWRGRHIRLPIR